MNDMNYGPNAWHKIPATQTDAYKYWKDLEKYMPADMAKNTCNSKGDFNDNKASPVNLRNTDDNCKEFHQLRPNRRTDHAPLLGRVATVEIKSHSLRISYPRVGKEDLTVPSADIPQGWGKFLHVAYCEFKVPASHTMQGKKFVAEMNCYIIQKAGRGLGVFTILFEIGSFNKLLDQAICAFQTVWQTGKNACSRGGRRDLEEEVDVVDNDDGDNDFRARKFENTNTSMFRDLQENSKCGGGWNPFEFMYQTKSWHFYGYRGTLMEPPCSQIVEHRVFDTPAEMSIGQLEDMKKILFTHQDPGTCQYTSVHNKFESVAREFESVARPLQPSQRSRIHRCTCRDFISYKERNQSGMRTCPRGQEARWMANPTDLVPAPGERWDL
uniref:carbonic anhydrase n=1 Tax=Ditylum brightwellii TaxID=49249 RepID=A0A7S4R0V3_9STRA